MRIVSPEFGVWESIGDEEEIAHYTAHPDDDGLSGELMRWLVAEGFLEQGTLVAIEKIGPGHFRVELPELLEAKENEREREQAKRSRVREPKPPREEVELPPGVSIDISCSFCSRTRHVIVGDVSYCKRCAHERGIDFRGRI